MMRKASLRENGCKAPAIEKIYPLREDKILRKKYNIKKSLVIISKNDAVTINNQKTKEEREEVLGLAKEAARKAGLQAAIAAGWEKGWEEGLIERDAKLD